MKKFFYIFLATAVMTACNNSKSKAVEDDNEEKEDTIEVNIENSRAHKFFELLQAVITAVAKKI